MGNSLSLSGSSTLSGEELKRNSKEITEMSNALFQFMYTNWQPRDVWEIANDPSKYVIAISDRITTQFHVLGYKTKAGRLGEIYFQKWDSLEPPMDKDQWSIANSRNSRNEKNAKNVEKKRATRRQRSEAGYPVQKQNAEIIAFYFVRIFQILGAMLLVVKDINIPSYNQETGETIVGEVKANASRNFAQQSQQVVSGFRPPTFKGGARDNFSSGMPLGPYDFLRYYLRRISAEDIARFTNKGITLDTNKEFMFDGSDTMLFEFTPYSGLSEIGADNKTFQKIGFGVKTLSGYEKRYINISVKEIIFDISHTEERTLPGYKAPSDREEKMKLSSYPVRLTVEYDVPGKKSSIMLTRVSQLPSNLSLGVEYQFSSDDIGLITFLKSQGLNARKDFVKILENISMYFLKQVNGSIESIKFETVKKVDSDDDKIKVRAPKNKSLETTFTQLISKEHQPHCIARALQLLDPASINNFKTGNALSNVCNPKLGGTTKSLSEYVPTRSVGQLYGKVNPLDYKASIEVLKAFAQKDSSGDPLTTDGVNNMPSEVTELQAAIKRLSIAFGIEYTDQKGFSNIEIKASKKCDPSTQLGKTISIARESNKFREMKSISQQLLAYHLKQVIEISKFLKKIFNISQRPDGSWKVEGPKTELLFAGFETMNTLTDQARALLINYYAGCEEIYQKGVKAWEVDIETAGDKQASSSAPAIGQVLASPNKKVLPVPSAPLAPVATAPKV